MNHTFPAATFCAPPASRWRLPFLESLQPRRCAAAGTTAVASHGLHLRSARSSHALPLPGTAGQGLCATPYLEPLAEFRKDFTVISGLSHPGIGSSQ